MGPGRARERGGRPGQGRDDPGGGAAGRHRHPGRMDLEQLRIPQNASGNALERGISRFESGAGEGRPENQIHDVLRAQGAGDGDPVAPGARDPPRVQGRHPHLLHRRRQQQGAGIPVERRHQGQGFHLRPHPGNRRPGELQPHPPSVDRDGGPHAAEGARRPRGDTRIPGKPGEPAAVAPGRPHRRPGHRLGQRRRLQCRRRERKRRISRRGEDPLQTGARKACGETAAPGRGKGSGSGSGRNDAGRAGNSRRKPGGGRDGRRRGSGCPGNGP